VTVSVADAIREGADLPSDSPRLDAELLLAKALQRRREYLLSHPEQLLAQSELQDYRALLERRKAGEPVAYLLGSKGFWDFELAVTPAVLIPRPETELIVEQALALYAGREQEALHAVDLGTGSGALAIALARLNPAWQLTAVDTSAEALQLAQENAQRLQVSNIRFSCSSWCAEITNASCDLIVSNPPYIEEDDEHLQSEGLPFEPQGALVAAEQGLADIRQIVSEAKRCLKQDAWLLIEHGYEQAQAVHALLNENGYVEIHCQQDYAGNDRMSRARWPGDVA